MKNENRPARPGNSSRSKSRARDRLESETPDRSHVTHRSGETHGWLHPSARHIPRDESDPSTECEDIPRVEGSGSQKRDPYTECVWTIPRVLQEDHLVLSLLAAHDHRLKQ